MNLPFRRRSPAFIVGSLWLVATAFNLFKPVTMDDAYYLQIAQAIVRDPLHVMSQTIYSNGAMIPIFQLNQPHLLFYLFAAVISLAGPSLIALHLLQSLFTLAALIGMYRLARRLIPDEAAWATAAFGLGAAFLPGQNLMTDVPLVALSIWAFICMIEDDGHRWNRAAATGLLIGAACLIKYTALALLPLWLVMIVIRRHWSRLGFLFVPLVLIVGWSLFNIYDVGLAHILQRPTSGLEPWRWPYKAFDLVIGLGSVWPFGLLTISWRKRIVPAVIALAGIIYALIVFVAFDASIADIILRAIFFSSGLTSLIAIGKHIVRQRHQPHSQWIGLGLWAAASVLFLVFIGPFLAVRHILLIMPAVIIATAAIVPRRFPRLAALAIVLGIVLAIADWQWVSVYPRAVRQLKAAYAGRTIWFAGHWQWQWYAAQAGFKPLALNGPRPDPGQLLIVPTNQRVIPKTLDLYRMHVIGHQTYPAPRLGVLRTILPDTLAGYYGYNAGGLPWGFSAEPLETFTVYEFE